MGRDASKGHFQPLVCAQEAWLLRLVLCLVMAPGGDEAALP